MANPDNVRQFTPVEIHEEQPDPAFARAANAAAVSALALGLKTLSQRAIAGARTLFTLLSVASCFWLWASIPKPDSFQLVALGMYAAFSLAAIFISRKA